MKRPDQRRFDLFARHFEKLDEQLDAFCSVNLFQLDRNILRQPCRVPRRKGNPEYLIDISLAGDWRQMPFEENVQHDVGIFAYYEPPEGHLIWKKSADIVRGEPFYTLRHTIGEHLAKGLEFIDAWKSDVILGTGQRIENLRKKHNGIT